jgi:hypothetical protein
MVYYTFFHSVMSCGLILGGKQKPQYKCIQTKKRVIRIMVGAGNRDSCRKIFKLLKILTLTSQHIYSLVMFVVNNMELFAENSEMYKTVIWKSSKLHLPSSHLTIFQKCSQYFGIKFYNGLPGNIKQLSKSTNPFKNTLLQYLHLHSFYNLNEFF